MSYTLLKVSEGDKDNKIKGEQKKNSLKFNFVNFLATYKS